MRASEDPIRPDDDRTRPLPSDGTTRDDVRRDAVPVDRDDARTARVERVPTGSTAHGAAGATALGMSRQEVVAREKQRFGGMKMGSAFFGWLTATGSAVLLTALVAGAGAAIGLGTGTSAEEAAADAGGTIGLVGAIVVLVVLFVAYLAGGYVAGRMARFSGAKQGLGVWIWAILVAIVLAIVSAIAGSRWNVLANLDAFPRLPFGEGELTTLGIVTAVLALVVSLAGAVLGGLAGMRFHRRVDREGLGR
ncbi:hypothetical protein GCM10009846_14090 [Agrococcus versicolor]|uniref:Major facilitator superfamily (MFS) profile domain-containing protein n=1 Tax=Agrococcus versicolor TaxID=501482 RepID=A0ABN3AQE3_9MICO